MKNVKIQNIFNEVEALLKKDKRLLDNEGEIIKNALIELVVKLDVTLLKLLSKDKTAKKAFFASVDGVLVFDKQKFLDFVNMSEFLPKSYTAFENQIGLATDKSLLANNPEVVVAFPYKDCVLEGGQEETDEKRDEVFFNTVLAPDEVDRLRDPKVLTGWKKYDKNGNHELKELDGKDNLIIRGNNLLALYSLLPKYRGQIKLIYIDPPYNIGSDDFRYNDSFNHSTWLVFMKNRLKVAEQLLSKDGAIFVQIDHHEVGYLNVLMDEVFGRKNKVQIISVKTASPAGFKTVNPGPIDVTEYVLFYTKDKAHYKFKRGYVASEYDGNYDLFIENREDKPSKWKLTPLRDVIYRMNGIKVAKTAQASSQNAKDKWGAYWKTIRDEMIAEFALNNADKVVSVRDPHKPSDKLKNALEQSKKTANKVFVFSNTELEDEELEDIKEVYLFNGGALAFYSNKVRKIDNRLTPTILLTDLWNDLSWDGIAKEGGVKLKNGKKPEALLKRIIEITTEEGDTVLDYHLGSGTTCAVAHKMKRHYIGIEQLNYEKNDAVVRLQNVIQGDTSGISKSVEWKGGGSFVYAELMELNTKFIDELERAKTSKAILGIYKKMKKEAFFRYEVDLSKFIEKDFAKLPIKDQKQILLDCLDANHFYVNYSEIKDATFKVGVEDKELNKQFYE